MNQREDYQEAVRIEERLYQESGHANPRLQPREQVRQRADQLFAWHDEGSERVDPKTGMTRSHHQAPLLRNGNRLRGGNLLHGYRHQDVVSDFFLTVKVFHCQAMAIPL